MEPASNVHRVALPISIWLGDRTPELEFCHQRLKAVSHVVDLQPEWLLDANWRSIRPRIAFVGVASRCNDSAKLLALAREQWPSAPTQLILGDWFRGHRRSNPLDESIDASYWYQVWDQVLPRFHQLSVHRARARATNRIDRILAGLPSRHALSPPILTLVITDSADRRQMWWDAAEWLGTNPVFISRSDPFPHADFRWIVLDNASEDFRADPSPSNVAPSYQTGSLAFIKNLFPRAKLLVIDPCPDAARWSRLLEQGADAVLPNPFRWSGVFTILP